MSISSLRNSNSLDKLLSEVQKDIAPQTDSKSYVDERLWKPELDKSGNGYAVIRFLPQPEGENLPWAKMFKHAFQGSTGKWFIENCLTSVNNGKCPCCEYNSELWNSGVESDKEVARKQKRKLEYYSNIYVVSDPAHPENEGKVFLFRYGKKIYDKIMAAMQPEFQDETPINPFDLWEGANFKLKIRKVDGYWNYDKSEFESPSQLADSDDALERIYKSEYSLADFTASDNFKSYDELKKRLNDVLNTSTAPVGTAEDFMESAPAPTFKSEPAPEPAVVEEEDDAMSYFQKLAND